MFIQTEQTPNPSTLKFLPGRVVMEKGTLDFASADGAGTSPLAKRLFAVDLKSPEGREIVLSLVEKADVVVENFRPGTLEGWGIGADVMRARNPRLIVLRISGHGQDDPDVPWEYSLQIARHVEAPGRRSDRLPCGGFACRADLRESRHRRDREDPGRRPGAVAGGRDDVLADRSLRPAPHRLADHAGRRHRRRRIHPRADVRRRVRARVRVVLQHERHAQRREAHGLVGGRAHRHHPDAAAITALGLHALQHRGQEAAGIVSFDGKRFHSERRMGLVGDNFSRREVIDRLPGTTAVGHVRYSTTGETILRNVQPLFAELEGGGFAIGHNGNLTNGITLRKQLVREGAMMQSTTDTEVILHLVAKSTRNRFIDRFIDGLRQLEGAYAFVGVTNKKLVGARDPLGIRPLVLGKLRNLQCLTKRLPVAIRLRLGKDEPLVVGALVHI